VLAAQCCDGDKVVAELQQALRISGKKMLYAKHMAKQKIGISNKIFKTAKHIVRAHFWV
jgi:hypothetical protein